MEFELWSEAEALSDAVDDACNIQVTLADGRRYALNVWTFSFFSRAHHGGEPSASRELSSAYMIPPDLFVEDLGLAMLQAIVGDLLRHGTMPENCLVADDE